MVVVVTGLVGGPGPRVFTIGALPWSAANMAGAEPSMPRAQMPSPAMWYVLASCAFSANEVGLSNHVWCHWDPTRYEVHGV